MQINIKEDQSIFDVNAQYYNSTTEYLTEFILDNKDVLTDPYGNLRGLTLSFRDELVNLENATIKSYTDALGDFLTEIENMTFSKYYDYNNEYQLYTNDLDILGASLRVDIGLSPSEPTFAKYNVRSSNLAVLAPNKLGTVIGALANGSGNIIYSHLNQDGTTDLYSTSVTVTNQDQNNISLKSTISSTNSNGYGDLFYSEFSSNDFLVDGVTQSSELTTTNFDLDPNGAYLSDVLPAFLGTQSFIRDLSSNPTQSLFVSYKNAFKIENYPNFSMELSDNELTVTNYNNISATAGDLEVYPNYFGDDISIDYSDIVFKRQQTYTIIDEAIVAKLLYTSPDSDIELTDGAGFELNYTASATSSLGELLFTDLNLFDIDSPSLIATFESIGLNLQFSNFIPFITFYDSEPFSITGAVTTLNELEIIAGQQYVIDLLNVDTDPREIFVDVSTALGFTVSLAGNTGDVNDDTVRTLFTALEDSSAIDISGGSPNNDVIISFYAVEELINENNGDTVFNPVVNKVVDLNLVSDADTYDLNITSSGTTQLTINGETYSASAGTNNFLYTASATFSTLSITSSQDDTISDIQLFKNTDIYILSGTESYTFDLNINKTSELNYNLLGMNYYSDGGTGSTIQLYHNGVPLRYAVKDGSSTFSTTAEFNLEGEIDYVDDNTLIIDNIPTQQVDTLLINSFTVSRQDNYDLMATKYNKSGFIFNPDLEPS